MDVIFSIHSRLLTEVAYASQSHKVQGPLLKSYNRCLCLIKLVLLKQVKENDLLNIENN